MCAPLKGAPGVRIPLSPPDNKTAAIGCCPPFFFPGPRGAVQDVKRLLSTISGQAFPFERIGEFADNGESLEVAIDGLEGSRVFFFQAEDGIRDNLR